MEGSTVSFRATRVFCCSLAVVVASCSAGTASVATAPQPTRIDAAELRRASASNVYDAINQLRPAFFATRGGTSFLNEPPTPIVVIVDRVIRGGIAELRNFSPLAVRLVRRLNAAEVYQLTGQSAPSGGIELVLAP